MKKIALLSILMSNLAIAAPDSIVRLEGISIQGNSEEPQVIYITPWQEPPGTGRLYEGATSFREQWMHTIDDERLKYDMVIHQQFLRPAPDDANAEQ